MTSKVLSFRGRATLGAALILLVAPTWVAAQSDPRTSRIVGRVVDANTGVGLPDVGVQLVGTAIGTTTGLDGRYVLLNVPAGTATIQVRRIGFRPKTITGLMLPPDEIVEQIISLEEAKLVLQSEVITAAAERGSVNAALDRQRTATGIVNAVTREQIAKSADSDAAQAVQRVSGVTVQDGKYVFVRGLGERYTTASLNGARIPSPEPERKVVPLDLFPAALLQSVTTSKTFTPDQSGDFSGAQVDIQTREFPTRRQVTYATSVGMNSAATGRPVYSAPRVGMEWLGFGGADRQLAPIVPSISEDRNATPDDYNRAVATFRNAWLPTQRSGAPSSSSSITLGGSDPVLGHTVGYIASGSYSYSQEVRADERRAQVEPIGPSATAPLNVFTGSTGRTSVLWGGLLNLSTLVGSHSRLAFNNTYSRTADNDARQDSGTFENCDCRLRRTLLRFVERSVFSSQLLGEHQSDGRHRLDWSGTMSAVSRVEPDRADLIYGQESGSTDGTYRWFSGDPDGAKRTFGDLREKSYSGAVNYRLDFGDAVRGSFFKIGAVQRNTRRDAENTSYSITAPQMTDADRALSAAEIFDGRFFDSTDSLFRVTPLNAGGSYEADEQVSAGYAMAEYGLTSRVRVIAGARMEEARLTVTSALRNGASNSVRRKDIDVLPSLAVNVALAELQSLRISVSRTLSRPEYREITPIVFRDAIGEDNYFGDTSLTRALIQNYDMRWEWYPRAGEILSVAAFAKRFRDPIERIEVASSGSSQFSWANADGAENYGLEFEMRKGLGALFDALAPVTVFSNVTVMRSQIRTSNVANSAAKGDRAMVGQAPYVINAGVTYSSASGRLSATALYNRVGERIHTVGASPKPDVMEQPRDVMDFSLRFPVTGRLSGRADAKNLFDAPFVLRQGTVDREYYRAGRVLSFGLSWQ